MSAAGTIRRALPDVDVDTGAVSRQLRGLPDGAQSRVLRNMRALSDDTKAALDATAVEAPAAKAAKIARYTGANGRRAMNALAETGTAPVSRLLRTVDRVQTTRALVRAWSRHDIDTAELREGLSRVDELSDGQRDAYGRMLDSTGDDAVEFAARSDRDAFDDTMSMSCGSGGIVAALGGGGPGSLGARVPASTAQTGPDCDLDGFRDAVARAADRDDSAIDSYAELDRAVQRIDQLPDAERAEAIRYVGETQDLGLDVAAAFDDQSVLRRFFDLGDDVDADTARDMRFALTQATAYDGYSPDRASDFVRNWAELEDADVDGTNRLLERIANQRNNLESGANPDQSVGTVSGTSFEARFASADEVDVDSIEGLEVPYTTSTGSEADIDVLQTSDGRTFIFDAKHQIDPRPSDIDRQIDQYLALRGKHLESEGVDVTDDAQIVFVSRYSREEFFEMSEELDFLQDQMDEVRERFDSNEAIRVDSIDNYEPSGS